MDLVLAHDATQGARNDDCVLCEKTADPNNKTHYAMRATAAALITHYQDLPVPA